PGVTLVRAELDDFAFPVHSHDHVVVGLATAGEHTSRYGLRRYDIGLGDVLLVNAGEVHDGRPSGGRGRQHSAYSEGLDRPFQRDVTSRSDAA
ncbi:MAG TPA: AraC family ligand binding domain-containing protein, partial [Polyangiaceae bacterium]|nr:AraC family ligand binding domain-containing protein [Polyangiaceae bacterium]